LFQPHPGILFPGFWVRMSSSPTAFSLKRWLNLGQKERKNFRIKSMLFSSGVRENRRYLITKLKICQEFFGAEGF
jgi:hypothetical protein